MIWNVFWILVDGGKWIVFKDVYFDRMIDFSEIK